MNPKLSPSVSIVPLGNSIIEFFKTNTRQHVRLRTPDDAILHIVGSLDGAKSLEEIAAEHEVTPRSVARLLSYLEHNGILSNVEPNSDLDSYEVFRRPISFLQDFSVSHDHLIRMWDALRSARVVVVGLGAVGSWVTCCLIQVGVRSLALMDPDVVELSNLHRQFGYRIGDIGRLKVEALADSLERIRPDLRIEKYPIALSEDSLERIKGNVDLIINCADKPTVDQTSRWVGEYCMPLGIPHIVGGGYNLHLSLIGQTIIPGRTACVRCFEKQLERANEIDPARVKKLQIPNRKAGSLGPLCALNASMIAMEAVKVLTKCAEPANANRRGEFDVTTMDVSYTNYKKLDDCEWCGEHGKYPDQRR